jgi:hypothetical protein
MKTLFYLSIIALLVACGDSQSAIKDSIAGDTSTEVVHTPAARNTDTSGIEKATWLLPYKLTVLVLPPYDEIANAGISPAVQKYLEAQIDNDTNLSLINFSYKQFMNVSYQNVYDKKYCQPIIDKRKTDVIVMSKLDLVTPAGKMDKDKWNLSLRIYNTNTGKQSDSKIVLTNVAGADLQRILASKQEQLRTEVILSQVNP